MVKYTLKVANQKVTIISTSKALMVTSEMRQLMVQVVHVLLREMNASLLPYESTITTIVETGTGSALLVPTPVTDIMEELTL